MVHKPPLLSDIRNILDRVNSNTSGIFSRIPEPIYIPNKQISRVIGNEAVHISEFIIAKIKGLIPTLNSHPEITDEIFCRLPQSLCNPASIIRDTRSVKKYMFVIEKPLHLIVIGIKRIESGKTEINTIYRIDRDEQRRLNKFPTA